MFNNDLLCDLSRVHSNLPTCHAPPLFPSLNVLTGFGRYSVQVFNDNQSFAALLAA